NDDDEVMMMVEVVVLWWCHGGEAAAVWVEWGGDGAREGEWVWGSNRSEDGECFWSWPEKSAGKLFRRRRGGGRRWGASPEKVTLEGEREFKEKECVYI
ncbi:hypothetical protein Tco_0192769, partial [Tanacetum coccineum]